MMGASVLEDGDTTVEEKQKEQEEQEKLLRSYMFTCEGSGAKSTKSPKLVVPPPGIQIYFLRYGLVKDDLSNHPYHWPLEKKATWQNPLGAPKVTGFKYARTCLRKQGWIYVYKEDKKTINGFDANLLNMNLPYTLIKDKTIWVCYSEIQWGKDYEKLMVSDAKLRSKRMQKISFDEWWHQQSHDDGCHVDDLDGAFQEQTDFLSFKDKYRSVKANEEDPERKEFLFFCLHDHFDIAYQLYYNLLFQWNKMDSLLISVKTGISQDKVEQCLKEKKSPESLRSKEDLEQIKALIDIATTLQGVAFANSEAKEKLGAHLDKPRLDTILAKTERHQQRQKIKTARILFVLYLKSDFFSNLLEDFIKSNDDACNYGKYMLASITSILVQMPNYKDAFFDEPYDQINWDQKIDIGKQFLGEALKGQNNVGEVFLAESVIDDIESQSNFLKFVGIANGILDIASGLTEKGPVILEDLVNVINKLQLKAANVALASAIELDNLSSKFNRSNHPLTEASRLMLGINENSINAFNNYYFNRLVAFEDWTETKQLSLTRRFEQTLLNNPNLNKLSEVQSSAHWAKLLRGVSLLNMVFAGAAIRKANNEFEAMISSSKFLIAMLDFNVASRNITQYVMKSKGVDDEIITTFVSKTNRLSSRVQFASIIIDTAEAGLNFWERDYDAAWAYAGSAMLTALSIGALAATNIWNPIGWGLAIASIGVAFYAAFLEDDPLERYVKNCVFGDIPKSLSWGFSLTPDIKFSGNYIQQINKHITDESRDLLLKSGFGKWSDYREGFKDLVDIIYSGRVSLKEKEFKVIDENFIYGAYQTSYTAITKKVFSVESEFLFGTEIQDADQLEYYLYYCPKGIGGGSYHLIDKIKSGAKIELSTKKDSPGKAKITFQIPKEFINSYDQKSVVAIIGRLNLSTDISFPFKVKGESRYIAATLKVILTTKMGESKETENYKSLKINTIQNILNGNK